jgi:hypothetical protein
MKLGKYRHYKGKYYNVIAYGTHTETDKKYVVYKPLYGTLKERRKVWIRTWDDFHTWGNFNGRRQNRFVKVPNVLTRMYCWYKGFEWY